MYLDHIPKVKKSQQLNIILFLFIYMTQYKDWEPKLLTKFVHFYILAEDKDGNPDIFFCTNQYLSKGKFSKNLTDLIGKRKLKQFIPAEENTFQVYVKMPEGNIFGEHEYILGCGKDFSDYYWYKKLGSVLQQGLKECNDSSEAKYLEQCIEKCVNKITKCEIKFDMSNDIDILNKVSSTLKSIEKRLKDYEEDEKEDDDVDLITLRASLADVKERTESLMELRDTLASVKSDAYKGYI